MGDAPKLDLNQPVPTLVPWATPLTWSRRFKFLVTGVLLPLVTFVAVMIFDGTPSIHSPWQNGQVSTYVELLLSRPSFGYFIPINLFSMVALTIWCFWPETYRHFWLRLGLYAGTLLTLVFTTMLMSVTAILGQIMALAVWVTLAAAVWLVGYIRKRAIRFSILHLMVLTTLVALFIAIAQYNPELGNSVASFFGIVMFGTIGGSSTLAFLTFLRCSVAAESLAWRYDTPRPIGKALLLLVSWLGALALSWKLAIESVMDEYAQLPTTDPNCFVCTAAATGHPTWVGAVPNDESVPINRQMCRLKFLELVMAIWFPWSHQQLRKVYNRLGPKVALLCRANRWFADFAFASLKPVEWLACLLQACLQISSDRVLKLYRFVPRQN